MKGRRYSVRGDQNIASPSVSMIGITATTAVEPGVYMISWGSQDTPADSAIQWDIQRYTAAGTATAVTPQNLGPGTTAGKNHTAEPTYTSNAILWEMALNQRASHTVVLDPDGALYCPASANNGLGMYATHASSTVNCIGCWHLQE